MTEPLRANVPADVDAPDKIAWGLTARQLATLAVAGIAGYWLHRLLAPHLPEVVLAALGVPAAGLVLAVVLGRRDGLGLDAWLAAAIAHRRTPRRQTPTNGLPPTRGRGRGGAGHGGLVHVAGRPPVPAPLMLPADAVTGDGVIHLPGGTHAAVVACGTVNLALRTPAEQAALLGGFGRWLNSLTAPAQILVSTTRFDLHPHSAALQQQAETLPHPALSAAATDHATYLAQLGNSRDPLRRQVLIVVHTDPGQPPATALRRGETAARALSTLGVHARVLDGPALTAALAAAVDPYTPPVPGSRAAPQAVITWRGQRPAGHHGHMAATVTPS